MTIGNKALIPNPALELFKVLIGEWHTTGSHPFVPNTVLRGRASFEWTEGGAYILMRSEIDEPNFPAGMAIFGSDNVLGECFMLYFDERKISRKYDVTLEGNVITLRRTSPEFSQRMVLTIADDGKTMTSKGEMSRDGGAWEQDLDLTYSRIL